MDEKVDFDLLISSIPKELVNEKCFNEETISLIKLICSICENAPKKTVESGICHRESSAA